MQSNFEVVDFNAADNLLIIYGCIELTDMVSSMLNGAMPVILSMIKGVLQLDMPDFVMQIFVESVMRTLML